jgi:hypothetical protein
LRRALAAFPAACCWGEAAQTALVGAARAMARITAPIRWLIRRACPLSLGVMIETLQRQAMASKQQGQRTSTSSQKPNRPATCAILGCGAS